MEDTHNTEELLLMRVATVRTQRQLLEDDLAKCRRTSKELALTLIFDFGYSLGRVERLTGHFRPTLRVWVNSALADGRKLAPGRVWEH